MSTIAYIYVLKHDEILSKHSNVGHF